MQGPDYARYSTGELRSALSNVDSERFPERVAQIRAELARRPPEEIAAAEDQDQRRALPMLYAAGFYALGVGLLRGVEVLELPSDSLIHPDFPPWLLTYLQVATWGLAVAGALTVGSTLAASRGKPIPALALAGAATMGAWILMHGWFLLAVDRAFGEGGLLWGAVHAWSLTRDFIPGGATEAGLAGYRVGQVFALVVWCIHPALLVALARARAST